MNDNDDSWQETHLNTRHIHNRGTTRTSQRSSKSGGNSVSSFDVARTFGTYTIKCPAADKLSLSSWSLGHSVTPEIGRSKAKRGKGKGKSESKLKGEGISTSTLEIYTLNEGRNAVVGEVILGGGVVSGTVVLAGSRKGLDGVVRGFQRDANGEVEEQEGEAKAEQVREVAHADKEGEEEDEDNDSDDDDEEDNDDGDEASSDEDEDEDNDNDHDTTTTTIQRVREFEKNSFRSPKFWMKWQGQVQVQLQAADPTKTNENEVSIPDGDLKAARSQTVTDTGYIVFSGNQCDRFQGTISCEVLGWKNVKMSGWKVKSQSARDYNLNWATT